MNLFDVILIIIMLAFVAEGFRRGFFGEIALVITVIVVTYVSFTFMNPLGRIFFQYLPILSLHLVGVEIAALNILFYQVIAFLVIAIVTYIAINMILSLTGLLTKITGLKNVLKIPLKILGGITGLVTGYIFIFLVLFAFSIPLAKVDLYRDSVLKDKFLDNKLLVIDSFANIRDCIDDVYNLTEKIDKDKESLKHSDQYNVEAIDIMLQHKLVTIDVMDELVRSNRIHSYKELDKLLNKYRKED